MTGTETARCDTCGVRTAPSTESNPSAFERDGMYYLDPRRFVRVTGVEITAYTGYIEPNKPHPFEGILFDLRYCRHCGLAESEANHTQ